MGSTPPTGSEQPDPADQASASDDTEPSDDEAPAAASATGEGPYPRMMHYQLLTPRAPLPPGAGLGVFPAPLAPSTSPAAWAADPYGRHQWRWWNGRHWTEHVADDGVAAVDPPT